MLATPHVPRSTIRSSFDRGARSIARVLVSNRAQRVIKILSFVLPIALMAVFVRQQQGQWSTLSATIAQSDWRWLGAGVALQLAAVGVTVATYGAVLRRVGYRLPWRALTTVCAQNVVVSTVAPVGAAGTIVAMKSLNDLGVSRDDAVFAVALAETVNYASTLIVLLPTAALLAIDDRIPDVVLIAVALMTVVLAVIAFLFAKLLGGDAPPRLIRWLPRRVATSITHARMHRIRLRDLLPALALASIGEIAGVAMVAAALRAVGHHAYAPSTPLIGYEVGNAASQAAPVYQGIGAVEIAMVLGLRHTPPHQVVDTGGQFP